MTPGDAPCYAGIAGSSGTQHLDVVRKSAAAFAPKFMIPRRFAPHRLSRRIFAFHQAKEFLSNNAPHQQSSPAKSLSVSLPSQQKSTTPLPAPNDAQIEALQLEVTKLQVEVKSLKSQQVKYTPLDITTKMQENLTSTKNLYENLKTTLDSIAPVMVRLTPNIPYIEEICRIVRQQNQNTSSTPALFSTEGLDTNQHVTTHPGSQKLRHE
ncbi:hypothetical protein OUZ56_024649 [Daphnia magna]|uniref:Uncharacterized protein n=1 Tax=Daphnia magna TaxID=35525 RepID=A0ABR0B157_9CRUS|nr:hypothetical protein OUZ56_024649 [Daphnia magna]